MDATTTFVLAAIAFLIIVFAVWRIVIGVKGLLDDAAQNGRAPYDPDEEDTEELFPLYETQPVYVKADRWTPTQRYHYGDERLRELDDFGKRL